MERSIEESFRVGLQENNEAKLQGTQRKTTQRRSKTLFLLCTLVEFQFGQIEAVLLAFVHNVFV